MSKGVGVLPQLFAEKKEWGFESQKNPKLQWLQFLGLYSDIHSMSCVGQNIKFTNLFGWIFLYFLEKRLEINIEYSKSIKYFMDYDFLNCYLLK